MSAIFGIINFQPKYPVADTLLKMQQRLNHWDADKTGLWNNETVGFGHLMLYNTPESVYENLPHYQSDSRLVITADARIDNREVLFSKLGLSKIESYLVADSTLILAAYQKYGEDCVKHLTGDFAFAIWDENEQKLFCAHDQMGIKPIFYYQDDSVFAFASEKKGLLALAGNTAEISNDYLLRIAGGIKSADIAQTVYRNIYRLKPAHTLSKTKSNHVLRKYWELDVHREIHFKNPAEYSEAFREKFAAAIQSRLRSNYLIATELSGGLDSSGITCVAASLLHKEDKKIASFSLAGTRQTAIYRDHEERDNEFISAVHHYANIDFPVTLRDSGYQHWAEEIEVLLAMHDGPEYCNIIWSFPLKKNAGLMDARTILSGFGGDELVTNFSSLYYLDELEKNRFYTFFKMAAREHSPEIAIKQLIRSKFPNLFNNYFQQKANRKARELFKSAGSNFLSNEATRQMLPSIQKDHNVPASFKGVQKLLINSPHNFLRYEAETLAGNFYRTEPRFPMADVPLMEFVLALPADQKIKFGQDRYLFRTGMKGLMPDLILNETEYSGYSKPYSLYEWQQTQVDKLKWINDLEQSGEIPYFLNLEKIEEYYKFTTDSSVIRHYAAMKQIEAMIKFSLIKKLK